MLGQKSNRTNVVVDNNFPYNVVIDIISENEDPELKYVN